MRVEGLTVATDGALDIPSGPSLPLRHEEGNIFLLVPPSNQGKRPTLYVSDGVKWTPAIASADDILNGATQRFLTAADVKPSYRGRHTAGTNGLLSVTWPIGRFTTPPIVRMHTIVPSGDLTHVYMANLLTCTATGMTAKVTRSLIGTVGILLGGSVLINEVSTVAVDVMVSADALTEL